MVKRTISVAIRLMSESERGKVMVAQDQKAKGSSEKEYFQKVIKQRPIGMGAD